MIITSIFSLTQFTSSNWFPYLFCWLSSAYMGSVRLTLFQKRKSFRIFLENSQYCRVNKTGFPVLEKKTTHNIIFLDFSNFSAPESRKLGRHSKFSGMGMLSQSNGLSKFSQEFLFRKSQTNAPMNIILKLPYPNNYVVLSGMIENVVRNERFAVSSR